MLTHLLNVEFAIERERHAEEREWELESSVEMTNTTVCVYFDLMVNWSGTPVGDLNDPSP
jgi:hypothetical protein